MISKSNFYSQMDLDVMFLLREKLVFELPLVGDKIGFYIGLQECRYMLAFNRISYVKEFINSDTFRFIIEDLVLKLESVLGVRNATCQQYTISDVYLINQLAKFLPNIMKLFMQVSI